MSLSLQGWTQLSKLFHEMLAYVLESDSGLSEGRARALASHFVDAEAFCSVKAGDIREVKGVGGRRTMKFSDDQVASVIRIAESGLVDPKKTVAENYLAALCRSFTKTQVDMIRGLDLAKLNPNPFLIKSLNLTTPEECVRFNVYALSTRSIVTSMGFAVEKFLLASSEGAEKGKKPWDIVKTDANGERHWIQVKSGPNDMDKDQVLYWSDLIDKKVRDGDRAYIGMTYGRRANETVSINHLKTYFSDWGDKTLIGRELWDFVADDPRFQDKLFDVLVSSAREVISDTSVCEEIDMCIERITAEFVQKYGDGEEGIDTYIRDIF